MQGAKSVQNRVAGLNRHTYALLVGLGIGITGGLIGLMLALLGPVVALGALGGLLAGLYILTDVRAALYGVVLVMILLPFGTLPVRVGFTPTVLDAALGVFILVYLFQWMTGRRQGLRITPVHFVVLLYVMWLIITLALGLRHAPPTATVLRQFAGTLLSIGLVFVLVDLLRDPAALRRLVLVIMLVVSLQALAAVVLFALPDATAESLLVRLARLGYPPGGVIRYIEDNPALGERAIGTWVDPNALGGLLAMAGVIITPQIVALRPVLRWRWLSLLSLGLVTLALFLTYSRAAFLAFGVGLALIAVVRYRRTIPVLVVAGLLFLLLPQTQTYIERLMQAFMGADLATQMRIGEWTDSLTLIGRYPVFGVGFTGTPDNDIYTDVANMYLQMANQIGLAGVAIYLLTMFSVLFYGRRAWRAARSSPLLDAIHLGLHAALVTALINSVADLYFFRLDFQASITWFWIVVALALASSELALQQHEAESTVVKTPHIM